MANYFAYETVAQRYARYRPFFHPLVIAKIRDVLGIDMPELQVLDVACGTGQSTLALEPVARHAVGAEIAPDMLAECPTADFIHYTRSPAEALPFVSGVFDLVTVALAFHWFDRAPFLAEARRVLRPGGWLVLYTNGFTGAMRENPACETFMRTEYPARYPVPPRNRTPFTKADAEAAGFTYVHEEDFTNEVPFTPPALAHYLTTQSNVVAAVEQGAERLDDVYAWLLESVTPLFPAPQATFVFAGSITYLQKLES